ncbi:MAG: hypothetical protein HRK26_02435 [Rickettsiaceae bacterium H1]|nr:hypothetical protein [Rickettsiaceae bacterium H1]
MKAFLKQLRAIVDSHENKEKILSLLNNLITDDEKPNIPIKTDTGSDQDLRTKYVGLQECIELAVAMSLQNEKNTISAFIEVIHTVAPSTPLRTEPTDTINEELKKNLHPEICQDENRLKTILNRQVSARKLLTSPGGTMILIYKQETETKYFKNNIKSNAEYQQNLICQPQKTFEQNDSGASMLIEFTDGNNLYWDIRTTQASEINDKEWKMTLGETTHKDVAKKMEETKKMLNKYLPEQDLFAELLKKSRENINRVKTEMTDVVNLPQQFASADANVV